MAVTFDRIKYTGRKQAFWRGEAKILPAGFHVNNTIAVGTLVKRGAFIALDHDTLSCGLVKVGEVITGGTATKPRVAKDNYFAVGDTVFAVGGTATAVIKSIDATHSDYDVITFDSALTGLAAGAFLVEADTTGDTAKQKYTANAVVGADKHWKEQGSETLDAAYDVLVIKDNVPTFPKEWIAEGGFHLATNPSIRFIKQ